MSCRPRPIVLVLLLALAGCQPATEPAPTSLAGDALLALRARYGAPTQVFSYNPQRVDVFRTASGGALATGSQAFLDITTGSPAPGPLRLEVREVLTKADMVLSGVPSMGQGEVYESGGHYLVQASTADHRYLLLSPRVKLGLAVPTPPQLTGVYNLGVYCPAQFGSLPLGWQPSPDTASSVRPSAALFAGDPVYLRGLIAKGLYDTNSGWLSFARPFTRAYVPTSVRVHTDQPAAAAGNAAVYLVFSDYNAVAQLAPVSGGDFALPNMPGGAAVTVFALYGTGGKLYFGQRADTIRTGRVLAVALTEHSAAEVAALAHLLP